NESLFTAPATAPTLQRSDDELEQAAKEYLLETYPQAMHWNTLDHGDTWTNGHPWHADKALPFRRCRTLEITEPGGSQAEMVYVDLYTAKVIFRNQLHCNLQRQLHHRSTASANIVWREGDPFPGTLNAEDQEMIAATEETYNLYYRSFGRDGHDGAGSRMRAVSQAAISGCPNARAFGYTILACSGVVGDDIVGHEWTHNYTTAMNGLLFEYASGAIQESMADIFGEAIDLLNDRGLDNNDNQARTGCFTDNYRWSIAEDATAIDTILRDLWSPTCKTDPDRRYSPLFVCNTPTGPDIHSNSAIVSRTFALLVDGDTTTTPRVRGIGLTKALHLFYHANANYVTRVTDFSALATMLQQAAEDLAGINLPALTLINTIAPLSNDSITSADMASLDSAITVTQLALTSQCPSIPALAQNPPDVCPEGEEVLVTFFREDWENGPGDWTLTETPAHPEDWSPKPWQINSIPLPNDRPGHAMFAPNAHVGDCQGDRENGTAELTSPIITVSTVATDIELHFLHYFSLESGVDGGVVSYRMAGEEHFTTIPQSAFIYNGYNGDLQHPAINDNPLAGAPAFTGADELSTSGTWGKSIVDLSSLGLSAGDQFQLRWTLGHDGCDGWLGWYLDDIEVGFCGDRVLPVTYLSLSATADKGFIDLDWQTATEVDNLGFYVERMHDNGFQPLGFVPANNGQVYTHRDLGLQDGTTYIYRLRQLDLDGQEHLSPLISATTLEGTALHVYPNPTTGAFSVKTSAERIDIYDVGGRKISRIPVTSGQTEITTLPAGIYFVRAGKQVQRIIVY
ncbi:MAG: M4 family metallopeptidase, partial [Bacteroidota bacterium]